MIITKNKHQNIMKELNAIIENQAEDIETLTDQVSDLVDKVVSAKQVTKDVYELLDYDENDVIIANVTNFLIEQDKNEAAKFISRCKIGRLSNKKVNRHYNSNIVVLVHLFLPGDSYEIFNDNDNQITKDIKDAFKVFFSTSYVAELLSEILKENKGFRVSFDRIDFELNMRRLDPKESDIQLFFDKVDALKSKLKQVK